MNSQINLEKEKLNKSTVLKLLKTNINNEKKIIKIVYFYCIQ